jgi:putative transposase
MSHPVEIQIEHHMSIDELNKRIKTLEDDTKVLRRLYFIKYHYEGKLVSESAKLVGITKRVVFADSILTPLYKEKPIRF